MNNLNELSKKEITKFARQLAKTNTVLWNAICMTEELVKSDIFRLYHSDYDNREEFLIKLSEIYKNIKKNDDSFAEMELHGSYFQDFDDITNHLQEHLW